MTDRESCFLIKVKDLIEFLCEIQGYPVTVRPINKKERAFLKSQGERVDDETTVYVIEKIVEKG